MSEIKFKVCWLLMIIIVSSTYVVNAQIEQRYFTPTSYNGLFTDQSTSIQGQSLGNSMVNLDGVANFIYNPAAIGPGEQKIDLHLNYLNQHPLYTSSHYPFLGASYRVHSKVVVAASLFMWNTEARDWLVTIGGRDFERGSRSRQTMASIGAAYTVIPNLYLGFSANYLQEKSINGARLNGDYILSLGALYDRSITLIEIDEFENESIRISASFTNILLKNKLEQKFEDRLWFQTLPIYLRVGSAYSVSVPFAEDFGIGKPFFQGTNPLLDFTLHLHVKRAIDGPNPRFETVDNGFGIGLETTFHQRFSLQMGHYSEQRAKAEENSNVRFGTSPQKSGFTWGIGSVVPVKYLTEGRFPFDVEVHLTFSKMMNELDSAIPHPDFFSDDKRQFGLGINLKWN